MLTTRQNLLETIRGGNPDRFVNQYEYLAMTLDPIFAHSGGIAPEGGIAQNEWGIWIKFPQGMPGPFPMDDPEHVVIKDIEHWQDYVHAPDPHKYSDEEWAPALEFYDQVDRDELFASTMFGTGVFERVHYLMGIDRAMLAFVTNPDEMHGLIDYISDWEVEVAKEQVARFHPDAVFHHDDWGSHNSTFMSPAMFDEFLLPAYKKIYGYFKDHGVEVIVHHSDSYAATLVPEMIECGVDIFQGAVDTNNIPELLDKFGGQISIHGGLNNGIYDIADWSRDSIDKGLRELIDSTHGGTYLIPGLTMGGPGSTYPGVYEYVTEEIDNLSKEYFG